MPKINDSNESKKEALNEKFKNRNTKDEILNKNETSKYDIRTKNPEPFYSTFRTSLKAFLNVSFGRAPIAICGCPSLGIKSSEGML
jgi:hypothetical protein